MKKFLNKKTLFILALFLFFLLINYVPSYAYYAWETSIKDIDDSVLITDTSIYNSSFIQGCIDAGQSPIDAAKDVVDKYHAEYPDTILCTSSDLPQNAFVVKWNYWENEESFDHFYIVFTSTKPTNRKRANAYLTDLDMMVYPDNIENNVDSEFCDFYWLCFTEGGFELSGQDIYKYTGSDSLVFELSYHNGGGNFTLVASNYDILNYETSELVFQQPTLGEATTLAPVIQREKTRGTLQVVMKEIIQILPLIIVVLVSFLGLRKALKILFQLLRQS